VEKSDLNFHGVRGRGQPDTLDRVGLFGNREKKAAKDAAAQGEVERLLALPVPELSGAIMPAFGPNGLNAGAGHRQGPIEVTGWLLSSFSSSSKYRQPLLGPVIEGLQALEHAGLVGQRGFGSGGSASTYHATRAGEEALADGSVVRRVSATSST
jgi:hypothetical protein